MRSLVLPLIAAAILGVVAPSRAAPVAAGAAGIAAPPTAMPVAEGCGWGRWRGPWGGCRGPGGGPGPGYFEPHPTWQWNGCPPGSWRGPWGHCRDTPFHGRLPGGGWK